MRLVARWRSDAASWRSEFPVLTEKVLVQHGNILAIERISYAVTVCFTICLLCLLYDYLVWLHFVVEILSVTTLLHSLT